MSKSNFLCWLSLTRIQIPDPWIRIRIEVKKTRSESALKIWNQCEPATLLVAISGPKKVSILAPPPPLKMALVMDLPPSKPLRTALYKQQVHLQLLRKVKKAGLTCWHGLCSRCRNADRLSAPSRRGAHYPRNPPAASFVPATAAGPASARFL